MTVETFFASCRPIRRGCGHADLVAAEEAEVVVMPIVVTAEETKARGAGNI